MRPALIGLLLAGCQPAVLNPVFSAYPGVGVGARAEPAAVMVLLDRSGSMSQPLAMTAACGACAFPACDEAACPTRMGVMRRWGPRLMTALGGSARWGLTRYPHDNVCTAPTTDDVVTPIPAAPQAGQIAAQIEAAAPGGGTPTAAALAFAAGFQGDSAERMVLLVTDGLPNCNASALVNCTMPTCHCTLNGGNCGTTLNDADPNNFCRRGCLDEEPAVDAVRSLTAFGIFTLVVGFGSDFTLNPDGNRVLDAMSAAATAGVRCGTDADCFGAFTCSAAGSCEGPALRAADEAGLDAVTEALRQKLSVSARCRFTFDADVTAQTLRAWADGEPVSASDFVLESPRRGRLLGESCRLAREREPGSVVFRVED